MLTSSRMAVFHSRSITNRANEFELTVTARTMLDQSFKIWISYSVYSRNRCTVRDLSWPPNQVWFEELCLYYTADALRLLVSTGFVSLCFISFRLVSLCCLISSRLVSLLLSSHFVSSIIFCLLLQSNFLPLSHFVSFHLVLFSKFIWSHIV